MRYMVTYSHQKRNKDGKKLKAIETLLKNYEESNFLWKGIKRSICNGL